MRKTIDIFLTDKNRETNRKYCRENGYRFNGNGWAINPKTKRKEVVEIWVKDAEGSE